MIFLQRLQSVQDNSKKEEGSVTVFLALVLVLILSFLLSMLELARVNGLQTMANRKLQLEMESVFGGYNKELWEHYGLLFLDISNGNGEADLRLLESRIMEEAYQENRQSNVYRLALKDVEIASFIMATDQNGVEFKRQACRIAKQQLAKEGIDALKEQVDVWKNVENETGDLEQTWKEALEAQENADNAENTEKSKDTENESETGNRQEIPKESEMLQESEEVLPENPIHYITELKSSPLLAIVLGETSQLSGKGMDMVDSLDNRTLFCGNMTADTKDSVDKLWLVQYLNHCFSCKTKGSEQEHVLDYELEYCIAGKDTDKENLEEVVKRLLILRQSANFVAIMKDSQKKELALKIATGAVGFTGSASLIRTVQMGVLIAWCYGESILDVRCLLRGEKVPLIKDSTQWKCNLFQLSESISGENQEKQEVGMSYQEYLQILLYMTEENQLTMRALNMIEKNIRLFSGNDRLCMDTMTSGIKVNAVYSGKPLFFSVIPVGKKINGDYYFYTSKTFMYEE